MYYFWYHHNHFHITWIILLDIFNSINELNIIFFIMEQFKVIFCIEYLNNILYTKHFISYTIRNGAYWLLIVWMLNVSILWLAEYLCYNWMHSVPIDTNKVTFCLFLCVAVILFFWNIPHSSLSTLSHLYKSTNGSLLS